MRRDRFDFEELTVFRKALDLVAETDRFVIHLSGHRRGLGFQMFDAASSVVLNLAESRRRTGRADRARFLDMANGSASETAGALCIAERLNAGPEEARRRIRTLALEVIAMLSSMAGNMRRPADPSS